MIRATEWWHAIGSDARFKPLWWQRRAYAAGIRDAMRILEKHAWQARRDGAHGDRVKIALVAMHNRAEEFEK